MNDLFGPLSAKYCNLFLLFSAFGVFMVFAVIFVTVFFSMNKKFDMVHLFPVLYAIITYFVMYLQNRILYNMCNKSI